MCLWTMIRTWVRRSSKARAAIPERHSIFAQAFCAEPESRGDEGALEFSVHREIESAARPGAAEGHRGNGLFPADQGLGKANRDRRPSGADVFAGRFGIV